MRESPGGLGKQYASHPVKTDNYPSLYPPYLHVCGAKMASPGVANGQISPQKR